MLYNKINIEVARFASKNDTRQEIAGVFFKPDRTVATDSFRLVEITTPSDVKVEDYPKVQGKSAMRGFKPFIVNAEAVKKIKISNKNSSLPVLDNVAVSYADSQYVNFLTSDLETANEIKLKKTDSQFPDYEKIFPTGKPAFELELNAEYLKEILDTLGKINKTKKVTIKFYDNGKPLVIEAKNERQSARAMLMMLKQ